MLTSTNANIESDRETMLSYRALIVNKVSDNKRHTRMNILQDVNVMGYYIVKRKQKNNKYYLKVVIYKEKIVEKGDF